MLRLFVCLPLDSWSLLMFELVKASRERERIQQERIRKEEAEVRRLASSFRAKRLPLSSVYVSNDDDCIACSSLLPPSSSLSKALDYMCFVLS